MIDIVSKTAAEEAVKALGEIGYVDPNAPAVPDTPVIPDEPEPPVQTADTVVYFAAAALIALLGAAFVSRKIYER